MVVRSEICEIGDAELRAGIEELIPHLRAFARSLTYNEVDGDDLVQEAVLKAWRCRESFARGTSLKNWLFMIIRNQFYSDKRRSWRSTTLEPEVAERTLLANDDADATLSLNELRQALRCLPETQREAIILVGAGGLSYEEAAAITRTELGTIKSRVSRGRDALAAMMSDGRFARDAIKPSAAYASIQSDFEELRRTA